MEEINKNKEINKNLIIIGDSSNTFIEDNDKCINFKITNNLNEYNTDKYKKTIIMTKNYTDFISN